MSLKQKQGDQTRSDLLEAAFGEIHAQGFRAASLDNILKKTEVSKGALYHHFPNKKALGYAVLDEVIKPQSEEKWQRLRNPDNNPLDILIEIGCQMAEEATQESILLGCPICNLVNEMASIDGGFQERLAKFRSEWHIEIIDAIERGQANGQVLADVEPLAVANFLLATHDGASSVGKATQSVEAYKRCVNETRRYIECLRADK